MKEKILEISDKLRNREITEKEARKQFLFLFGVSVSLPSDKVIEDIIKVTAEVNWKDNWVWGHDTILGTPTNVIEEIKGILRNEH